MVQSCCTPHCMIIIKVQLTVKKKTRRNDEYGEVRWNVSLTNQDDEPVAAYELLTMNLY